MHQHRHDGDTYRRIEVITGGLRRRRWSAAEKAALVAESLEPDVNVSALARRRGVSRGLLQTWRRTALREMATQGATFVPVRVEAPTTSGRGALRSSEAMERSAPGVIELETQGVRVRFSGPVDAGALRLVLAHLGRRG